MFNIDDAIKSLDDRDLIKAKTMFGKAVVDSNFPSIAHAGLAICYVLENNLVAAKRELESSTNLGELGVLVCIAYGLILEREGNTNEAEDYFTRATKIDPDSSYAHRMRGWFLLVHDRVEDAIISLLQAKKLGGNQWTLNRNLATAYLRDAKYKSALREAIFATTSKPSIAGIELILISFFRAFPIALFIIYVIGIFFFLLSPFSIQGIVVLTTTLMAVEYIRFLMEKKRQRLKFIAFVFVVGLLYYFFYVR